jgi:peroxiredoxin
MIPPISLPAWPTDPLNLRRAWGEKSVVLSSFSGISTRAGAAERHLARLRSWQQRKPELDRLGYVLAFVSAQPIDEQRAWIAGSNLDLTLLSDVELKLADRLRLPTIEVEGMTVYDDMTVIIHRREVGQVFYPSREPQNDPETVMRFLRQVHDKS